MTPNEARQTLLDRKRTVDSRGLVHAVADGNLELVRLYLVAGVDPDEASPKGEIPLETAVIHSHTEIARLLLQHGANVDVPLVLFQAVYAAAFTNDIDMIDVLAAAGVRLTDVDEDTGLDALGLARDMGQPEIVKAVERLYGL